MNSRTDIRDRNDIRVLVHTFYSAIRSDADLAPVFALRIADDAWGPHLERMTLFWSHILLQEPGFTGNPFQKHVGLPVTGPLFDRWLTLWHETVRSLYDGPRADEAMQKARNIADVFRTRLC